VVGEADRQIENTNSQTRELFGTAREDRIESGVREQQIHSLTQIYTDNNLLQCCSC
jgi:hypothetical protein